MLKSIKKDINKYVNNEIESLQQEKQIKILKLNDDMHDYAVIKNISKFSLKKTSAKKAIQQKSKKIKNKIVNTTKKYNKSIKYLEKNKSKSFLFLFFTQLFRRLGFNNFCQNFFKIINENKLMLIILIISIIVGSIKPVFFTKYNIFNNVLKNNATIGIMAIGMTFVILTGGIDLSVGSILGLTGIFSMGLALNGMNTFLAFTIGFLISFIIGSLQGFLVAYIKLPPFIVTLVGLLSIRGIIYIYADGSPKTDVGNKLIDFINQSKFIDVPFLVWILVLFVLIGIFILKYTHFGRKVYSVGGNEEAAKLSGINTKKILIICYAISGFMAGVASLAFVSKISSAGPESGASYELDVIAAVVLGGTSLFGGKGGVGKTFLGWLVISTLGNALQILGLNANWQLVFKGIVILIAVILDKELNIINKLKKIKNQFF